MYDLWRKLRNWTRKECVVRLRVPGLVAKVDECCLQLMVLQIVCDGLRTAPTQKRLQSSLQLFCPLDLVAE